ncbi:unnamed protein product [Caenorhabditis nigoni]
MITVSVYKWGVILFAVMAANPAETALNFESQDIGEASGQFTENIIGGHRQDRAAAITTPTTDQSYSAITATSTGGSGNISTTNANTQSLPPLLNQFMACSKEKIPKEFVKCVEEGLNLACKNYTICSLTNVDLSEVFTQTLMLFSCAKFETKCSSDDFKKLENTLNESAKSNCNKSDCTGDVDKWFDQMFPNCVRNGGFNCEPIPTTTTTTTNTSKEESTGNLEYVPPHEDLPEDFSCENLGEKYKACEYLCKQLASLKPYEEPGIDWRFLPGAFMTAGSLLAIPILFVLTKRMTNELAALNEQKPTTADVPNAKLKIAYAAALDVKDPKYLEKKKEKSQEVPSPPLLENKPAAQKMAAKLLETQQNLQKLRSHAKKCVEEHKKDAASSKFQKKGAIYIPNEPEIPSPAPLPDNIILDNVEWCSDYNEMYVIGSDVDDIELEDDSTASSLDESTKIEKRNQTSKKSKKSKKSVGSKKTKSKKSQNSKKSKKDVKIKDSMSKIQ